MRKWLVFLGAVIIGTWLLMWFGANVMGRLYTTDADRAWPLELGTLNDAKKRYPQAPATPVAYTLIDEAAKLGINIAPRNESLQPDVSPNANPQLRTAIADYLSAQIQKTTPEIDPPPPAVAEYLASHAGDLVAIRSLLLGDEEVEWTLEFPSRRAPIPNLLGHMVLMRVLLTNALDRARRGEAGAWDDARAAVALGRGLWKRPEIITALIGLAIDRNVNAVARKLPLPPPAWFDEFQKFDRTRAMMAARQAEASRIAEAISAETAADDSANQGTRRVVDTVMSPYTRLCIADALEADRRAAAEVAVSKACGFDPRAFALRRRETLAWWNLPGRRIITTNLDSVWQRVFRFRAEAEATDRALRLRAGQPPLPDSSCSDGSWVYSDSGFRFSRTLSPTRGATAIPLEFTLGVRQR